MSSTKRGGKRSEADWYSTPPWCIERLLEKVDLPGGVWLDPGAGDGALIKTVNSVRLDVKWHAVEIRSECRDALVRTGAVTMIADFLDPTSQEFGPEPVDVVITNPPYALAEEFIARALKIARKRVVMLLRLNYLGSEKRHQFMQEFVPDIHVLPNRPQYSLNKEGKPGSDSIEYAWFDWDVTSPRPRTRGELQVLNLTPKAVRSAYRREVLLKLPKD